MAEPVDAESAAEPIFRSNKRRKVFRKRTDAETETDDAPTLPSPHGAPAADTSTPNEDETRLGVFRADKRPGAKKQGIGFSSTQNRGGQLSQQEEQGAMTVAPQSDAQEPAEVNRFVKQTGRVGVTEDRHMLAFVDRKMAEMRSATPVASGHDNHESNTSSTGSPFPLDEGEEIDDTPGPRTNAAASNGKAPMQGIAPIDSRQKRRRRKRPGPDPNDIARDSLVDQIVQESQSDVPIYSRPVIQPQFVPKEGVDNDAAVAQAFKAQLLADLAQSRRRRGPPPVVKPGEKTSHGPKLGGSRSQRQRMRAYEEANANAAASGKDKK